MKQSDAVQFLYRDLQVVTSRLVMDNYDLVFEEEMQEYFPFNDTIMDWLKKLYQSEKYGSFGEKQLSLYYEKEHPFLFIRDLAHINSWNQGYYRKERRDHITGLMFSESRTYALEATYALCKPSMIKEDQSQWFDFKQAMQNLEQAPMSNMDAQAWKACSLFYLYIYLSRDGQEINRQDLIDLLEPYIETLEVALYEGDDTLKQECQLVTQVMRTEDTQTFLDGLTT
jgi:hypothetical protein